MWRATPVLLWPDTFNNYFLPDTAKAAVEVLESAGFRVMLPRANLCCGRPLYDWGMLDRAKHLLLQILDALETEIEQGIPMVVLEPSCATVFRDELLNLFPKDERARRLSQQTFLLSEFLETKGKALSVAEIAAQSSGSWTLSSQIGHENDRRRSRPSKNGNRFSSSGAGLLRHGRERSALNQTNTKSRSRSANWNFCPQFGKLRQTV